jgi:hypothetical protein
MEAGCTVPRRPSPLSALRGTGGARATIADTIFEPDCYVLATIRSLVCTLALLAVLTMAVLSVWYRH